VYLQDYDPAVLVLARLGELKARFHRLKVIFADRAYGRSNLPECVNYSYLRFAPDAGEDVASVGPVVSRAKRFKYTPTGVPLLFP